MLILRELGVKAEDFFRALEDFEGASKRLEQIGAGETTAVFKDFAHSPSKLKATVEAVSRQFSQRKLVACMELHTYSSLNQDFLEEYRGSMTEADIPVVYFNPHALKLKRLPMLDAGQIKKAFIDERLTVFSNSDLLYDFLLGLDWQHANLLMMSSGDFNGMDLNGLSEKIT
jgi:UDP-N-acetylmuramate: L-alanyl-gamma-D-glutamyl-meso-diaminopimelate ligase